MYKIDKSLVDNMNNFRSCIVITHKDTVREKERQQPKLIKLDNDEQIPAAVREKALEYVEKANLKSQQIISTAEAEAEELVSKAQAEAEQIRENARSEGYLAGIEEGRAELNERLKAQTEEVRDVLSRVETYRQELYDTLESHVLSLSMDVAEKILNIQMERDDTLYKDIVRKAVAGIKHTDNFTLYVGQAEYDKYFKDGANWVRQGPNAGEAQVICDPKLPKGSCVIEADSEIIDAGVPIQLKKIDQFLREQVE